MLDSVLNTPLCCHDCVKSVQIWSFFQFVFSRIRTEYGENLRIWTLHFTNVTNIIYNLTGWEERIISFIIWMVYFRGKRLSRLQ